MRVVLSTNSTDRGGTSRTLEAWTRLLPREGVTPIVTVGGPGPLLTALQGAKVPVSIHSLRVSPRKSWPFPFAASVLKLARTIRSNRASVLHVNEHDSHPVAVHAARLAGVPIVTHLRFRPSAEYCQWLFRRGRVPDRLLFTSRTQMADSAEALRPVVPEARWRLVPNGLDFTAFQDRQIHRNELRAHWGLQPGSIALGIACVISPRKRVDHFIRLVAGLRDAGIAACGFVAGRGREHFAEDEQVIRDLHQLATSLRVGDHVRFLGYVEPAAPLYSAWDLCVSTSEYETFGMTVLEAMACACAVVTYPGGSVAEIVGGAASVVPDGDEAALLRECVRLSRDPAARRDLGARGRHHAESTYDIGKIVPLLAAEYRLLVGNLQSVGAC